MINKDELLQSFIQNFPEAPHRMRSTLHSYDEENLCPSHLEDDVWAHTMLAYNSIENFNIILGIAVLCHDYGKIYTRTSHTPGKINFWGHSEASTPFTMKVCKTLCKEHNLDFNEIFPNVIFLVNKHDTVYNVPIDKLSAFLNYNQSLANLMGNLLDADIKGQIRLVDNTDHKKSIETVDFLKSYKGEDAPSSNTKIPTIWLYCGTPGSGKDYIANQECDHILSLDKVRLQLLNDNDPNFDFYTTKDAYAKAFDFCKNRQDLGNILIQQLIDFWKNTTLDKVAICNTNLSSKTRKQLIKSIRKHFPNEPIGCKFIFSPLNASLYNDQYRLEKTVGAFVVKKFAFQYNIPTMSEGFDVIKMIYNEGGVDGNNSWIEF